MRAAVVLSLLAFLGAAAHRPPSESDKPRRTPQQRAAARARDWLVSKHVQAGEDAEAISKEFGVQVTTVLKWARRGGGLV